MLIRQGGRRPVTARDVGWCLRAGGGVAHCAAAHVCCQPGHQTGCARTPATHQISRHHSTQTILVVEYEKDFTPICTICTLSVT